MRPILRARNLLGGFVGGRPVSSSRESTGARFPLCRDYISTLIRSQEGLYK